MCMGGGKPAKPTPLPEPEQKVEQAVSDARDRERQRKRAASGVSSTFLTGGTGVTAPASLGYKTLLGA